MLCEKDIALMRELQKTNPEIYDLIDNIENYYLEILSHTCHDLKNTVGLIDGYAQLIELKIPQICANPLWTKLHNSSKSSIHLLNSIGELRYSHRIGNMEELPLEALLVKITGQYPSLSVITRNTVSSVYGNIHNITSSLLALLQNSLEAADPEAACQPTLTIENDTQFLHFIIADNGCGFTADSLPRVFDPFYSEKREHTGLGLSIAHNTALRHGGNLIIRNPHAPTIVDFYIPLKPE